MTTPSPTPPDSASSPAPRRGGVGRWVLWGVVLILFGLILALFWLVGTDSGWRLGSRWLSRVGVVVEEPTGRLWDQFGAKTVRYTSQGVTVVAHEVQGDWSAWTFLTQRKVVFDSVSIARLETRFASSPKTPATSAPSAPPAQLAPPLPITIKVFQLGAWILLPETPTSDRQPLPILSQFQAALAGDPLAWSITGLKTDSAWGTLEGEARLQSQAPFALAGHLNGTGETLGRALAASAVLGGSLTQPTAQVTLAEGDSRATIDVTATPYEAVPFQKVFIHAQQIDPAHWWKGAPRGLWRVDMTLVPGEKPGALKGEWTLENTQSGRLDQGGVPALQLHSGLDWSEAGLKLAALTLGLSDGGKLNGEVIVAKQPAGTWQTAAQLDAQALNLGSWDARLPITHLGGHLQASIGAEAQHLEAVLADDRYALNTVAHYTAQQWTLEKGQLDLRMPGKPVGSIDLTGQWHTATGALKAHAQLQHVNLAALQVRAPVSDISLSADVEGKTQPSLSGEAQYYLTPGSQLASRPLTGSGSVHLEGGRLTIPGADLQVTGNQFHVNGAWGQTEDVLQWRIDAPYLAHLGLGVSGALKAQGILSGGAAHPEAKFELQGQQLKTDQNVTLQRVQAQAVLGTEAASPMNMNIFLEGLQIPGQTQRSLKTAQLNVSGTPAQHRVVLDAQTVQTDHLSMTLTGGWNSKEARWKGQLDQLQTQGALVSRLQAPALLEWQSGQFSLRKLELAVAEKGWVKVPNLQWREGVLTTQGALSGLNIQAYVKGAPTQQAPLTLGGNWDVRLSDTLNGQVQIFREAGDWVLPGEGKGLALGLTQLEVKVLAKDNQLTASARAQGDLLGNVQGDARAALAHTEAGWQWAPNQPLSGQVLLDMPRLAWLGRLMTTQNIQTDGALQAHLTLGGTPAQPHVLGDVSGKRLKLVWPNYGVVLEGGELLARFEQDQVQIEKLAFTAPRPPQPDEPRIALAKLTAVPGTLNVTGRVGLNGQNGQLDLQADHFPLLQHATRWLMASGQTTLMLSPQSIDFKGVFGVDAAYVGMADRPSPSLDDDVVILGQTPPAESGGRAVTAEIIIGLGYDFYIRGLGLNSRLEGEMRFKKAAAQPLRATGFVAAQGGTFKGYGQNLSIEHGIVTFAGPVDNPWLDVIALRKGLEVEAGLAISGNVKKPIVRLVSQPNVPDTEKLGWIVLGHPPGAGGGAELGLLIPAAQALLGLDGEGMTSQLQRGLGLDEISLGQGDALYNRTPTSSVLNSSYAGRNASTADRVLTLGKRLSSTATVAFEQSLSGAQSLVRLTIELTRNISLISRAGTDNSMDIRYSFSFR